jgi:hypothetical protein
MRLRRLASAASLAFALSSFAVDPAIAATPQWTKTHNGPGNGADAGHGIALDATNNVYVTGERVSSGGHLDYVTISYEPDGDLRWGPKVYDGPGAGGADVATAVALDGLGGVVVTGRSQGNLSTGVDFATIKYNQSDGVQQWVARYDSPSHGADEAAAIAVDAAGNVIVTGTSAGDWATVKYDINGVQLWAVRRTGGTARDVAVDPAGNVYVVGSGGGGAGGAVTVKYGPDGNQLWVQSYTPPPPGLTALATTVVLDSLGNV